MPRWWWNELRMISLKCVTVAVGSGSTVCFWLTSHNSSWRLIKIDLHNAERTYFEAAILHLFNVYKLSTGVSAYYVIYPMMYLLYQLRRSRPYMFPMSVSHPLTNPWHSLVIPSDFLFLRVNYHGDQRRSAGFPTTVRFSDTSRQISPKNTTRDQRGILSDLHSIVFTWSTMCKSLDIRKKDLQTY